MSLVVASYNVLADAYINRDWYPRTPPELLAPGARTEALVAAVEALDADVVCLQEAEAHLVDALRAAGHTVEYARKGHSKPDGCATVVRLPIVDRWSLHYADGAGGKPSGHVALGLELESGDRRLTVVNTHLRWNPPDRRGADHIGYRQAAELIERCAGGPVIVCGDLNVKADSDTIRLFADRGFADAYSDAGDAFTCNPTGTAKRIDFLLHSAELTAEPRPLPSIDDTTPLPSDAQPSDHLAISATFRWR